MLDDCLDWNNHISYVCTKLLKLTSLFYKIRSNLTTECRKALYFAMVYPHLNYASELYGNATVKNLKPLQTLQNKLLRILQLKSPHNPTNLLYLDYRTFKLRELHELNVFKLIHKIIHHPADLPETYQNCLTYNHDIHTYETRHRHDIFVHNINANVGSKSLKFKSHRLWNNLPDHLKEVDSTSSFHNQLITLLNSRYM